MEVILIRNDDVRPNLSQLEWVGRVNGKGERMSISRHIDNYLSDRGIVQSDEVVPESECQVFDGQVTQGQDRLESARTIISQLLG